MFRDADGQHYLVYGGWRHCNLARLAKDFRSLVPFADGALYLLQVRAVTSRR